VLMASDDQSGAAALVGPMEPRIARAPALSKRGFIGLMLACLAAEAGLPGRGCGVPGRGCGKVTARGCGQP